MPDTDTSALDRSTTGESVRAVSPGTRLDAAHAVGDGPPRSDDQASVAEIAARELDAASGQWLSRSVARMRRQGRQLANLLLKRQQQLDRREAQQNAQAAELESQLRAARLWLDERHQELCERDERLAQREREVADRSSQLSAAEVFLDKTRRDFEAQLQPRLDELAARQAQLDAREQTLSLQAAAQSAAQQVFHEQRQQESVALARQSQLAIAQRESSLAMVWQALAALEARRAEIERQAEAVSRRAEELQRQANSPSPWQVQRGLELDQREAQLESQRQSLVEAEDTIARNQAELEQWRDELRQERERLADQARQDRRRFAEERRGAADDLARQREALEQAGRQIDARRAALDELRVELTTLSRETLETRVAAEELIAGLSTRLAEPALSKSLATGRARLADLNSLAASRLAEREAELRTLAVQLTQQSEKLSVQKVELDGWLERRQREFDQQATKLATRDDELRQLELDLRARQERFRDERLVLEREIRRLTIRLHSR